MRSYVTANIQKVKEKIGVANVEEEVVYDRVLGKLTLIDNKISELHQDLVSMNENIEKMLVINDEMSMCLSFYVKKDSELEKKLTHFGEINKALRQFCSGSKAEMIQNINTLESLKTEIEKIKAKQSKREHKRLLCNSKKNDLDSATGRKKLALQKEYDTMIKELKILSRDVTNDVENFYDAQFETTIPVVQSFVASIKNLFNSIHVCY